MLSFWGAYKEVGVYVGDVGIFGVFQQSTSTRNMQRGNVGKMEILLQRYKIEQIPSPKKTTSITAFTGHTTQLVFKV